MIEVRLEDEVGELEESLADPAAVMHRVTARLGSERFRLLRYVDPYGNTVFNGFQAADLMLDITDLAADVQGDDAAAFFEDLLRLVRRTRDEDHLYVRFVGD